MGTNPLHDTGQITCLRICCTARFLFSDNSGYSVSARIYFPRCSIHYTESHATRNRLIMTLRSFTTGYPGEQTLECNTPFQSGKRKSKKKRRGARRKKSRRVGHVRTTFLALVIAFLFLRVLIIFCFRSQGDKG